MNNDDKEESKGAPDVGTVDLTTFAHKATGREVYMTLVAIFNEDPKSPRVLADSEDYLAYTLKNGRTVRLIARTNNMKGSLRVHEKPIHALRFVNYRSNVAASSSENEFYVWVVTNENAPNADPSTHTLTVRLYFKLKDDVTICRFSFFINISVGTPDLLVLYANKVAVLESSRLIREFSSETLEANLAKDSRELRELSEPVTLQTVCCINNTGWFAFTTETSLVVACTLRNRGTPAWAACDDAPVKGLELLDAPNPESPAMLFACSDTKIFQWKLTGKSEPLQLRLLTFGSGVVSMLSSKTTLVAFNKEHQVVFVEGIQQDELQATIYPISATVRPGNVCFSRLPKYGCVLVDAHSRIEMYQFTVSQVGEARKPVSSSSPITPAVDGSPSSKSNPSDAGSLGAARSTPPPAHLTDPAILSVTAKGSVGPPRTVLPAEVARKSASPGSIILSNLMQQVQRGNLRMAQPPPSPEAPNGEPTQPIPTPAIPPEGPIPRTTSTTTTTTSTKTTTTTAMPAETTRTGEAADPTPGTPGNAPMSIADDAGGGAGRAGARALWQNTALPKPVNGPLAAALYESDETVRREMDGLTNSCKNINKILSLSPDQLARDHEQLLNLALEAQMTELQGLKTKITSTAGKNGETEAFNSFAMASLMMPIAQDIAKGVTQGIRDTLGAQLDNALHTVLGGSLRENQAEALKRQLDIILRESSAFFSNEVHKRLQLFSERELTDIFRKINASISELSGENKSLRRAIKEIMNTNVASEMQTLREELLEMKATLQARGASSAAAGNASLEASSSPETTFATVLGLFEQGKTSNALEYLIIVKKPLLILRFFSKLEDQVYSDLVTDTKIAASVWTGIIMLLCKSEVMESIEDTEYAAEVMLDILSERSDVLRGCTARTQQMISDLRHFITPNKDKITSLNGLNTLRDLEKIIQ